MFTVNNKNTRTTSLIALSSTLYPNIIEAWTQIQRHIQKIGQKLVSNVWNLFKVNNKGTPNDYMWGHSGVFIVNFQHISHIVFIAELEQVNGDWIVYN